MKVKRRRVRWSWLRIFCENRAGLCRVIGGQALKRPWKEQKALFVQNTVSKAQGTKTRRLSANERTDGEKGVLWDSVWLHVSILKGCSERLEIL